MTENAQSEYGISFVILAVLLIFLFIWNVNSGSIHLSVREILNIIFRHQGDETSYNIVWEIRLPRILAVIILGGALSVSGFLLQTFFNNPIAGPFVLGISSGAKLIVALLMIFFLSRSVSIGSGAMILAAFAGSMISMGFVLLVAKKSPQHVHAGYQRCHDRLHLFCSYRFRSYICG